ncbi:hypothetical protein C2E23DRAFT_739303 [Lenzites betulinus]|nr:hypothetical protein C2E23DRAFT_739303 [Lenzites betulinus]
MRVPYPYLLISSFLAISLAGGLTNAQSQNLTIQTPSMVSACVATVVVWTGGVAPYTLVVVPTILSPVDHIQLFFNLSGQSFLWTPMVTPESLVVLTLNDSAGAFSHTNAFIVAGSDSLACLGAQSTSTSSQLPSDATSSSAPPTTELDSSTGNGLSGGAIAGIVVGSLAAALVFAFLAMRIKNKRLRAARRRHRATRSDWQPMADMPSPGKYAFSGAGAQMENSITGFPAPPSPTLKKPGEAAGGIGPRRPATVNAPGEPLRSPF